MAEKKKRRPAGRKPKERTLAELFRRNQRKNRNEFKPDPAAEINSLEQIFIITEYTTESVTTGTSTASTGATEATQAAVEETTEPVGGFG